MKSVLASIKPKHCELITSGEKTLEIRKTRPKIDTPFKCYMYQTKGHWIYKTLKWLNLYQGKVIGEFVCDDIDEIAVFDDILYCVNNTQSNKLKQACLTVEDIKIYLGINSGYAWHISNLVIYDKPRELSEFEKPCSHDCKNCKYWYSGSPVDYEPPCCEWEDCFLKRPPQSWCYVEEVQ